MIRRTAGRRLRARPRLLRLPHHRRSAPFRRASSTLFGPPREPYRADRSRRRRRARASPTSPPACSACSRTSWSTSRATLQRETGLARPLPRRRRRAERRAPTRGSCASRASSGSSFRRAGRRRLRARRGALCRPHPLRQSRPATLPDHPVLGPGGRRRASSPGSPTRTASRCETARRRGGSSTRTAERARRRAIVGWMDGAAELGPRALGHRSILAAPHDAAMRDRLNRDIKYREEFRPFAPVVPVERRRALLRAAAGRRAPGALHVGRLPGAARVARAARRDHPCRRHRAGPDARARDGAAAFTPCSRPTASSAAFRCCSTPRSTSPASRSCNRAVEGYSTFRRCGIDVLVAGSALRRASAQRAAAAMPNWRRCA